MTWSKSSVPLVLAGIWVVLLAVEIGFLRAEQIRAGKICAALERKKQERDRLLQLSPVPTAENERAIDIALGEATRTLAALRDKLGENREVMAMPNGSAEAFFALNRFVDEARQRAVAAHVMIKSAGRFGFASYANEGPPEALRPVVHRQCTMATKLIATLLEARPLTLLALKREQPDQAGANKPTQVVEDYFPLPPSISLRRPGLMDTDAFRLEFTGQTVVLRQFLNALAGSPRTVVVRAVEVEPYNTNPNPVSANQAGVVAEGFDRPSISKFTVTLEIPLIASAKMSP